MKILNKKVFVTYDDKEFPDENSAREYEEQLNDSFQRYMTSYFGSDLLEKHKLTDVGVWRVEGEDANADLGGSHYMPFLGYFRGTLEAVLRRAVSLPRFFTWGHGGRIEKVEVVDV